MEADLARIAHRPSATGDPAAEVGLTSVVVVACNSGEMLTECLRRVLVSTAPVQVIVVDNASTDGSTDALSGGVGLIRNERNLGFARACNLGAGSAQGDALLFLNPDCLLEPSSIASLREGLTRDPQVGLLGARVLDVDGREQRGLRRRDPTPWRSLMSLSGLSRWEVHFPVLQGVEALCTSRPACLEYHDAVSGALLLLPRATFKAMGGFDEGYFMHCEDLDLCRRVRAAGGRVAMAVDVPVTHVGGTSSRARPLFVAWHKHRGMVRYYRRFEAGRWPFGTRWIVVAAIWVKFLFVVPLTQVGRLRGGDE